MSAKVSVVIPTTRENDDSYLLRFASSYPQDPGIEYLIVDRDSPKALLKQINRPDFRILPVNLETRAERLREGFEKARTNFIVFHHPRTLLRGQALLFLTTHWQELTWGGFTHQFSRKSSGLQFTSWYSNHVRPRLSKIVYLDHCIFFKRELLNQRIPSVPIFEDTEISKILRKSGPPEILPFVAQTSSIRFDENGFLKQALKNQVLKVAYHLGASKTKMNSIYEDNLNLN